MELIIAPISVGQTGPEVANLQDALFVFLERNIIEATRDPNRPTEEELQKLTELLKRERDQSEFGRATQQLIKYFQIQQGFGDNLRDPGVEEKTAARLNEWLKKLGLLDVTEPDGFVVRGTVNTADGQAFAGAVVRVLGRDLRNEQLFGETKTDALGQYLIRYGAAKFDPGNGPTVSTPSLIVRAFAKDQQIGNDVIRSKPARDEVVDFTVAAPSVSEWERLSAAVTPLLAGQGEGDKTLSPRELNDRDLDFITKETGLEREQLRVWLLAFIIGRDTAIDVAILYAWLRLGLPADPIQLWTTPTDTLLATLDAAITKSIVPSNIGADPDNLRKRIEQIKLDRILQTPAIGTTASLSNLLATAPIPLNLDQQRALAIAVPGLRPDEPDLVKRIAGVPGFDGDAVGVARTLRLGALTRGHLPLIRALQDQPQLAGERDGTLLPLTTLRRDQWIDLAYQHGTPEESGMSPVSYAESLAESLEEQHPTATLAARLHNGTMALAVAKPEVVSRLLVEHPEFDILKTDIDEFFTRAGKPEAELSALKDSIVPLRRIKRLDTSWDETNALLDARLDSSIRIAHRTPEVLHKDLNGEIPFDRVKVIHARAVAEHDALLALMTQVDPRFASAGTEAVHSPVIDPELVKDIPALQALFGGLDSCACGHCRSVLSPAAYFVDLLQFLEEQNLSSEALFRRRPDLADIELSCGNTDRELPAIDLVNEILENAVALPLRIDVPANVDVISLLNNNKGPLPAYVLAALRRTAADVPDSLQASPLPTRYEGEKPTWQVVDRGRRWVLQLQEPVIEVRNDRGRTTFIPLESLGADALEHLNKGEVSPPVLVAVEKTLGKPGRFLPVSSIKVESNGAPRTWSMHVERQAVVTADGEMLKVEDSRGASLVEARYSSAGMAATVAAADRSAVGGVLEGVVAGNQVSKVVVKTPGKGWILEGDPEKLIVTAPLPGLSIVSLAYQSSRDDEDLLAQPENRNEAAYENLRHSSQQKFPWTLPFDLHLLETEAFLDASGTNRQRLLEVIGETGTTAHSFAVLGLSVGQSQMIVSPATSAEQTATAWGIKLHNGMATVHDVSASADVTGTPEQVLSRVSVVLQQARLSHPELLDLLDTSFVLGGQPGYQILPLDTCEPSLMSIQNSDGWRTFDRLHRFIRLQRALAWKPYELDLALRAAGDGSLDPSSLAALAQLVQLQRRLGITIEAIATWWLGFAEWGYHDHTTQGEPAITPIYERVFRRRSLNGPTGTVDPTNLSLPVDATPLAAALGIAPAELFLLTEHLSLSGAVTREMLHALYRHLNLARSLRLRVTELLQAITVTGIDPFNSPASALNLCDAVKLVASDGWSWNNLKQILHGQPITADNDAGEFAVRVQDELQKVTATFAADGDAVDLLPNALARLTWTQKQIAEGLNVLASKPGSDHDSELVLQTTVATTSAAWGPLLGEKDAAVLLEIADTGERTREVLARAVQFHQREAIVQLVAAEWSLAPALSQKLLVEHLTIKGSTAIDALVSPKTPVAEIEWLHRRLARISILVEHYKIDSETLDWLRIIRNATTGSPAFELDALPADPTDVHVSFDRWKAIATLATLRDRSLELRNLLSSFFRAVADGANSKQLCVLIGEAFSVDKEDVNEAAGKFGGVDVAGLSNPIRLAEVVDLFTELHRLGASLVEAQRITTAEPDAASGSLARQLLRSRTTAENWPGLLKPIANQLRERQRDALIDYLLAREDLAGPEQLYAWFLIDPLRSACFKTTRLLQGISAVQLFVQRCLLGLERTTVKEKFDVARWEWMRTYRVWEANRKVFLYPENWLLPELRDDKSTAFKTLEGSLSQSEASDDAAQAALLAYVDDLAEVADIEVAGMWDEQGDLYVTGRTAHTPRSYFWRVCRNFGTKEMRWTAWERIDVDVSGTQVIPFVLDGAFHIAWPVFRQVKKGENTQQWEAHLAWSRRTTGGGWSKTKQSEHKIHGDVLPGKDERSMFTFRAETLLQDLSLSVLHSPHRSLPPTAAVAINCVAASDPNRILPPDPVTPILSASATTPPSATLIVTCLIKYPDGVYGWASETPLVLFHDVELEKVGDIPVFAGAARTGSDGIATIKSHYGNASALKTVRLKVFGTRRLADGRDVSEAAILEVSPGTNVSSWHPVLIFDDPNGTPPLNQVDPERDLVQAALGQFVFSRSDVKWSNEVSSVWSINGTAGYDLGFREKATSGAPSPVTLGSRFGSFVKLGPTAGRFIATPAAGTISDRQVWHYRNTLGSYFFCVGSPTDGDELRLHIWPWSAYAEANDCLRELQTLGSAGLEILLDPETQRGSDGAQRFAQLNASPTPAQGSVDSVLDQGVVFTANAPPGAYQWELFLHGPLSIADHLSRQRRFEDAQHWLNFVFAPLRLHDADPFHAWRFIPFQKSPAQKVGDLLSALSEGKADGHDTDLSAAIDDWRKQPFRPHAVARMRPSAYQWRTLFAYLDNVLAWADDRFTRSTRESIDEATLLYVLAAQLLGPRPRTITPRLQPLPATYRQLRSIDAFGNAWLAFADDPRIQFWLALQAFADWLKQHGTVSTTPSAETAVLSSLGTTYFCVPSNPALVGYWDRVEDRLFKIRHCQDIDGGALDLPLYDAPIDPLLLIRAVAAGVSISDAISGANAALPRYRFQVLVQKANEIAAELKSLGGAFLTALEKLDGERLAQLRSSQEIELLALVGDVREDQLREARLNLEGLRLSRQVVSGRYRHYQLLLGRLETTDPPEGKRPPAEPTEVALSAGDAAPLALTSNEGEQLSSTGTARDFSTGQAVSSAVATVAHVASAYFWTSFLAGLGFAADSTGAVLRAFESEATHHAGLAALIAGFERRRQEWAFQSNAAGRELVQLDKQIVASEVRVAIAQKEVENHRTQLENARELDRQMHEKFTNDRLYGWMTDQLSRAFFSTYQLAIDVAKKAERAYKYELGVEESATNYIQPGSWDSLKHGLLAGEKLSLDLKRMEVAYLDRNAREFEMTKHVSLLQLNPEELLTLKRTGACDIDLPEWLFDFDCPGHYFRRLKSVSLSIPCVSGPYASVNCTVILVKSSVRLDTKITPAYARLKNDDSRFRDDPSAAQRVVTSSGINDSGLFDTNLRDERYLPFEGRGAISRWRLELPTSFKQFDYDTITDVVLHVRYTARTGSEALKTAAVEHVNDLIDKDTAAGGTPRMRLVSLRHEFPSAWARLTAPGGNVSRSETFIVERTSFPFLYSGRDLTVVADAQFPVAKDLSATASPITVGYAPGIKDGPIPQAGFKITLSADNPTTGLKDYFLILFYTVSSLRKS